MRKILKYKLKIMIKTIKKIKNYKKQKKIKKY